jgi:hypothetical protein
MVRLGSPITLQEEYGSVARAALLSCTKPPTSSIKWILKSWSSCVNRRVSKSTPEQMKAALQGDCRPEHLFVLSQSLQAYRFYQARIEESKNQTSPPWSAQGDHGHSA